MKKNELEGIDFIREKVRLRDNHICQNCNKKWKKGTCRFDVHHLEMHMEGKKSYQYDKNNFDKMITMCHGCHLSLPHIKNKMRQTKFDDKWHACKKCFKKYWSMKFYCGGNKCIKNK